MNSKLKQSKVMEEAESFKLPEIEAKTTRALPTKNSVLIYRKESEEGRRSLSRDAAPKTQKKHRPKMEVRNGKLILKK